jgi:hypothetical protein
MSELFWCDGCGNNKANPISTESGYYYYCQTCENDYKEKLNTIKITN